MKAARLNATLRAAEQRAEELLPRLENVLLPVLRKAARDAAAAFERNATHHLTASAGRRADLDRIAALSARDARQLVSSLALTAAIDVQSNSTMVCVKPRPAEAAAITDPDGEATETLHVTLCYLGELDGPLEPIAEAVRTVAATHAPLAGIVAGYGQFGTPDGAPVGILLPDVPGLVELRVAITEALHQAGIDYARNHGFEAHVTVDQAPEPGEGDEVLPQVYGLPLHFDEVLIVRGNTEVVPVPLVGAPPVTAAGTPSDPGWTPPARGEILDIEALVKTFRGKTNRVRLAVVRTMFEAVARQAAALRFAAGSVEEIERFNVLFRAAVQAGLDPQSLESLSHLPDFDAEYRRLDAKLQREIEHAGFTGEATGEAYAAGEKVGFERLAVLRDEHGKMLGIVSYNPALSPAEVAELKAARKALDKTIAANAYEDSWHGSPAEQLAADRELAAAYDEMLRHHKQWGEVGVNHLASNGERPGIGARLMQRVAEDAKASGAGVGLNSLPKAEGFYKRLGMAQETGTHNYRWTAAEAKTFSGLASGEVFKPAADALGLSFDVTNPFTRRVFAQSASQVVNISETTQLNVMRIVQASYEAGLSIPDTAKAIEAGMIEASPARARLIARTELAGAVNGGALAATQIVASATGVTYMKTWMTAPGAKDPRHELYDDLDGQTVPLDGYFTVGGDELDHPGDPAGSPEEICNCRCSMSFTDESGDEQEVEADEE